MMFMGQPPVFFGNLDKETVKRQTKSILLKNKIQASPNDRFGLKLGTLLAQVGQRACPSWVTCLPLLGRFAVRRVPNKLMM
ncbi:hypothetical protein ST43_10610 [Prevotella pectinovora]|nr:hypothetical protein ST43_10610 [Prevotella pectinovora]